MSHINKLQSIGFPLNQSRLQSVNYHFAEKLQLAHRFYSEKKQAGWDWRQRFMKRQLEISTRASGMSRQQVSHYFDTSLQAMTGNHLLGKLTRIYNMDNKGVQITKTDVY